MIAVYCPGNDATGAFEDVGHSPDAIELQKKHLIGRVDGGVPKVIPQAKGSSSDTDSQKR